MRTEDEIKERIELLKLKMGNLSKRLEDEFLADEYRRAYIVDSNRIRMLINELNWVLHND